MDETPTLVHRNCRLGVMCKNKSRQTSLPGSDKPHASNVAYTSFLNCGNYASRSSFRFRERRLGVICFAAAGPVFTKIRALWRLRAGKTVSVTAFVVYLRYYTLKTSDCQWP